MPDGRWVQGQTWDNLLFAHWRVPEEELRRVVPSALPVDTFDGTAWLGITPFKVTGLRLRGMLFLPGAANFLELNVRTYVTVEGKPGIFFFGLDAASRLAVEGARRLYKLPYFHARMSADRAGDWIQYSSARRDPLPRPFVFTSRYRPFGPSFRAASGSLEHFLTERYCLYTVDVGWRVYRAEIHHPPWPLQRAEAAIELNTMAPDAVRLPEEMPHLLFSARQDVVIWALRPVG